MQIVHFSYYEISKREIFFYLNTRLLKFIYIKGILFSICMNRIEYSNIDDVHPNFELRFIASRGLAYLFSKN